MVFGSNNLYVFTFICREAEFLESSLSAAYFNQWQNWLIEESEPETFVLLKLEI